MAMNDETTAPESSPLRDLPALIRAGFNKVAEEHDIEPSTLLGEVLSGIVLATVARRAAKRGDTAKTVLYASALVRQTIAWNSRKTRVVVARAHADTMALRRVTLRTSTKEAM